MKKYTLKFSVDMPVNKYNQIWLSIELGIHVNFVNEK